MYNYVKEKPVPEEYLLLGKLGELLVSFYLFGEDRTNWDINWEITKDENDGCVDLNFQGWSIDVKTSRYEKAPLLKEYVNKRENPKDLYCLVGLNLVTLDYRICGFIQSDYFRSEQFLVRNWKGMGNRYIAEPKDLFQIKT